MTLYKNPMQLFILAKSAKFLIIYRLFLYSIHSNKYGSNSVKKSETRPIQVKWVAPYDLALKIEENNITDDFLLESPQLQPSVSETILILKNIQKKRKALYFKR